MLHSKATNPRATKHVHFDLSPSKHFFKVFFQRTPLGQTLKKMLLSKAVPEGLKQVECECGVGGNNSPIHYVPEQDPIHDALKTKKRSNHFKLTLLKIRREMRVAIWASGTLEHFVIHVHGVVNVNQQMVMKLFHAHFIELFITNRFLIDYSIPHEIYFKLIVLISIEFGK